MPLPTVVSTISSFSAIFLSPDTARSSLPAKRTVSSSPYSVLSRRDIALLSFLALSPPASAIDIGICRHHSSSTSPATFAASRRIRENPNYWNCCAAGPKNWLKEQKRKASKFLLDPVDASRQILRSAYLTLSTFFPLYSPAMLRSLTSFRFGSICSENRRYLYGWGFREDSAAIYICC